MSLNRDSILLESVRTHRARLRGAFLLGPLTGRRPVNDNVKRMIGSLVLAAVVGAGCVGTSFVTNFLADQAAAKAAQQQQQQQLFAPTPQPSAPSSGDTK